MWLRRVSKRIGSILIGADPMGVIVSFPCSRLRFIREWVRLLLALAQWWDLFLLSFLSGDSVRTLLTLCTRPHLSYNWFTTCVHPIALAAYMFFGVKSNVAYGLGLDNGTQQLIFIPNIHCGRGKRSVAVK